MMVPWYLEEGWVHDNARDIALELWRTGLETYVGVRPLSSTTPWDFMGSALGLACLA